MIVEFYGLPGSGKTFLAKALVSKNPDFVYLHTSSRKEIIKYDFLFFFSHPLKFLFWLKELVAECSKSNFSQLFRYKLHLLLIAICQYQKADKRKINLIDEGLYQRILAIYDRKITEKKMEQCFANIPKINLLIVCQHKETEFYRFKQTDYGKDSPRMKLGKEYFDNWEKAVRENDKLLQKKLSEKNIRHIFANKLEDIEKAIK